jgi:hypothetical protein
MTRGLMVEIYRYADKYFGGNCVNKFYETMRFIFQINKMITTEQCNLFLKERWQSLRQIRSLSSLIRWK